jgi:hypothetical protein
MLLPSSNPKMVVWPVIIEISSVNGYRNLASPNTYYFIHGPKNAFPKGPKLYN